MFPAAPALEAVYLQLLVLQLLWTCRGAVVAFAIVILALVFVVPYFERNPDG
jgi:hypothetical protein